jgi:hypothetical protein
MGVLDKLSKLGGLLAKPFEILADYASEPLRGWEHERSEASKSASHSHNKDLEQSRIKAESDARIREKESEANLAINTQRLDRELEEWVKDQEIVRFERVTEAVMRYRQQFVEMNNNAIFAIGEMQIELRRRAHDLVEEKTRRYRALQSEALDEAMADLARIEQQFAGNPVARQMLEIAVQNKLTMIIDGAGSLMKELNVDLKLLSESITRLADRGEEFVSIHLQQFHTRQLGTIEQLSSNPTKAIGKP